MTNGHHVRYWWTTGYIAVVVTLILILILTGRA